MNQPNNLVQPKVLVWDAPVRVFHALLVLSFTGAYLTAELDRWRWLHLSLGYTVAGLVLFRLVWGVVGTRHARFASFVRGPRAVLAYGRGLVVGRAPHFVGHNPAGAVAIAALLLLGLLVTATGWANYHEVGGEWLEEVHEGAANAMLLLAAVHVAGVLLGSWLHRENLPKAMLSGYKRGAAGDAIRWSWRPVALVLLATVLGFWYLQWQATPRGSWLDRVMGWPQPSASESDGG